MRGGHGGRDSILGRFSRCFNLHRCRASVNVYVQTRGFHEGDSRVRVTEDVPLAGQVAAGMTARNLLLWLECCGLGARLRVEGRREVDKGFGQCAGCVGRDNGGQCRLHGVALSLLHVWVGVLGKQIMSC